MSNTYRAEPVLGLPVLSDRWNTIVTIQPEQAKLILDAAPKQRPVSQHHVSALAQQMKDGRWARTNEGLAFDKEGMLFDGQHRLWACFTSGVPIEVLVCLNEPRENFDRIGVIVNKRSPGQLLVLGGYTDDAFLGNTIAGAARFVWAYDMGRNPTVASAQPGWDNEVCKSVLQRHPQIGGLSSTLRTKRQVPYPLAPLVGLACLMQEANEKRAAIFLHQIVSGEGLVAGDPALTLRASVLSKKGGSRANRIETSYRIARAWNAFYAGRSIERLYGSNAANGFPMRTNGMDPFPRIAGYHKVARLHPVVSVGAAA